MDDKLTILTDDELDFDCIYGEVNPTNFASVDQSVSATTRPPTYFGENDTAIAEDSDPSHISGATVPNEVDNGNNENIKKTDIESTHFAGTGIYLIDMYQKHDKKQFLCIVGFCSFCCFPP